MILFDIWLLTQLYTHDIQHVSCLLLLLLLYYNYSNKAINNNETQWDHFTKTCSHDIRKQKYTVLKNCDYYNEKGKVSHLQHFVHIKA